MKTIAAIALALTVAACDAADHGSIDPYESNAQGTWEISFGPVPQCGLDEVAISFHLAAYERGNQFEGFGTMMYVTWGNSTDGIPEMRQTGVVLPDADRARVLVVTETDVYELTLRDDGVTATASGIAVVGDETCSLNLEDFDVAVDRLR